MTRTSTPDGRTYFRANNGTVIGYYGKDGLMINSGRFLVKCYDTRAKVMSFAERALPEYSKDIAALCKEYRGHEVSEYCSG